MEYKLNEYHKNLSKEDLIEDLIKVSVILNKSYISKNDYISKGKYSASPYIRCFGSWIGALSAAGLETHRSKTDYIKISDEALIEDIKRIA